MIEKPTIEAFRQFARVDHTDDDATIDMLLTAAVEFVDQAVGPDQLLLQVERVKLAVLMLAAHWHEQREPVTDGEGATRKVPLHLRSLLHQLRGGRLEPEVLPS